MAQDEMNRESLENLARENENQLEAQAEPYVERPKSQRILAWVLFGLVALGVILYYFWLSGVLK